MNMPTRNRNRVLGIDPGTREMGVAILDRGELVYHGVLSIRNHRTPHENLKECRSRIRQLLRDFKPTAVVVEKTFFSNNRGAALLNVLFGEIRALARQGHVRFLSFAPGTIKKHVCGNGRAGKDEVAKAVTARFPELKVYLGQDRLWKSRHHANRFDAIAVAIMVEA